MTLRQRSVSTLKKAAISSGRAADRRERHVAPALLDLGVAQDFGESLRKLRCDRWRRFGRCNDGEPARRLHLGIGLRYRRQIGQLGDALVAADGEPLQPALPKSAQAVAEIVEHLDMPGQESLRAGAIPE